MKKAFCLKYVSFDISFFQSSVNQSCFYVKYQNNNKSFSAFHFSAWTLLAGFLAKSQWMKQKRKASLEIPLLLMETIKLWIQYFWDLGTKGFQISFSGCCTSYCNSDKTGQPTDWIMYWRQKCRVKKKQKQNKTQLTDTKENLEEENLYRHFCKNGNVP